MIVRKVEALFVLELIRARGRVQLIESRTVSLRYVVASLARIWIKILRVLDDDGTRYAAGAMSAQEGLKVLN